MVAAGPSPKTVTKAEARRAAKESSERLQARDAAETATVLGPAAKRGPSRSRP